ncbi:hypothetical protein B0H17DRAFT_1133491 [Mycena rosella]|uniref:Uncharacterized protein n=1 Tax=Mycena rosella TaxID=1033263 RepID=A0AAD7GFD8_MYCRO|nr:hypothetical protein B0H17DRAFT_1133491 [Mycena rosella]
MPAFHLEASDPQKALSKSRQETKSIKVPSFPAVYSMDIRKQKLNGWSLKLRDDGTMHSTRRRRRIQIIEAPNSGEIDKIDLGFIEISGQLQNGSMHRHRDYTGKDADVQEGRRGKKPSGSEMDLALCRLSAPSHWIRNLRKDGRWSRSLSTAQRALFPALAAGHEVAISGRQEMPGTSLELKSILGVTSKSYGSCAGHLARLLSVDSHLSLFAVSGYLLSPTGLPATLALSASNEGVEIKTASPNFRDVLMVRRIFSGGMPKTAQNGVTGHPLKSFVKAQTWGFESWAKAGAWEGCFGETMVSQWTECTEG